MDEMIFLRDLAPAILLGIVASIPVIAFLWIHEKGLKQPTLTKRQLTWVRYAFLASYVVVAAAFLDSLSDPSVTIGIVAATFLLLTSATLAFFRPFYNDPSKESWLSWMVGGAAMLVGTTSFALGAALQYINHYRTPYGDDIM